MFFLQAQIPPAEDIGRAVIDLRNQMAENTSEMLGLDSAYDAVISANQEFFGVFSLIVGAVAAMMVILQFIYKVYNHDFTSGKTFWGMRELWTTILLVFLIMGYQTLFHGAEYCLKEISDLVGLKNAAAVKIWEQAMGSMLLQASRDMAAALTDAAGNFTLFGFNLGGITDALSAIMAPNKFVYAFCAVAVLAGFFNMMLAYVVYIDRSLILLLLNTLAPFAFALSTLEPLRGLVRKFFMILITTFLIYPFILIGFEIVDALYLKFSSVFGIYDTIMEEEQLRESMSSIAQAGADAAAMTADVVAKLTNYDVFLRLPLLIVCIFLKLKYTQVISSTIWKILN